MKIGLSSEIVKPCPICGKMPKVYRDTGYETSGFGAWCTIQCKPLFRKPHLKVEQGKASWDRAFLYAIREWNTRIEDGVKELSVLRK